MPLNKETKPNQVFVGFLFLGRSNLVLIWQFHSVRQVAFAASHYKHGTSFYAKFHSNVLTVYSNCVY